MADNVNITPGSGVIIAADDVSGKMHQRVKLSLGIDGQAADALGGAGIVSAGVQRVTLASDDSLVIDIDNIAADVSKIVGGDYETIAASQTEQVLGNTGAVGDYFASILIIPATLLPGSVQIKDGSGSNITIFTGGVDSVSNLVPFSIPLGVISISGAWKVTTGANVSAVGIGKFT